jgi:hypothetical protein
MKIRELALSGIRFAGANRSLIVWLLAAGTLSYGFAATNFSLSIDEELHFLSNLAAGWISQGRWGIALTNLILQTIFPLPFFNLALAVFVLCVAALVWCFVFTRVTNEKLADSPWLKLFAVSYVTLPSNAYFLSFNTYNVDVALASLFSAAFALFAFLWAIERRGWLSLILASLFAMMAIAIYQSFLFVCATSVFVTFLLHVESQPASDRPAFGGMVRNLLYSFVPLVAGYALYRAVDFAVAPVKTYVDIYFNWGKLDTGFIFGWLWGAILAFFRGEGFLGGVAVLPLIVAGATALAIFIWQAVRQSALRHGEVFQLLVLLAILLSPFYLWFALGTPMAYRTQQVLPLAYSATILILVLKLKFQDRWRFLAAVITVLAILWNGQANTRIFLSEYLSFKQDETMAHEIASRLYQAGWTGSPAPLIVVGTYSHAPQRYFLKSETIGGSFFEWDSGRRAPGFMSVLGYSFLWPTPAQQKEALEASAPLPNWPRQGSVAFIDGIAIIKMGEPTPQQRAFAAP